MGFQSRGQNLQQRGMAGRPGDAFKVTFRKNFFFIFPPARWSCSFPLKRQNASVLSVMFSQAKFNGRAWKKWTQKSELRHGRDSETLCACVCVCALAREHFSSLEEWVWLPAQCSTQHLSLTVSYCLPACFRRLSGHICQLMTHNLCVWTRVCVRDILAELTVGPPLQVLMTRFVFNLSTSASPAIRAGEGELDFKASKTYIFWL